MSTSSLSLSQKLRENLKNSEARAIISFLVTLGYMLLNLLYGLGYMPSDAYAQIMLFTTPIQAVVVGFYFGAPKSDNSQTQAQLAEQNKFTQALDTLANGFKEVLGIVRGITQELAALKSKLGVE